MGVLPLIKGIAQVSPNGQVSIGDVGHPVLSQLPHLHEELPSVKRYELLRVS